VKDGIGETSLHYAASLRLYEAICILYQYGCNINIKFNDGRSPLHLAACRGHFEIIKALMKLGAKQLPCGRGCLPWVTASSLPDFKPILQMKDDILEEEISGQVFYRPGCNHQAASPQVHHTTYSKNRHTGMLRCLESPSQQSLRVDYSWPLKHLQMPSRNSSGA
jgi:ankyrin repeat protein